MSSNRDIIKKAIDATCDLENMEEEVIYDVENFRFELERAGLMTEKLDEFIENYMRWDNN